MMFQAERKKLRDERIAAREKDAPNGEAACEGNEFSQTQCEAVSCCHWDKDDCYSAVGKGPCVAPSEEDDGEDASGGKKKPKKTGDPEETKDDVVASDEDVAKSKTVAGLFDNLPHSTRSVLPFLIGLVMSLVLY